MNNTGEPQGKLDGLMIPDLVFLSINSQRVCNSTTEREYIGLSGSEEPSSIWIDRL